MVLLLSCWSFRNTQAVCFFFFFPSSNFKLLCPAVSSACQGLRNIYIFTWTCKDRCLQFIKLMSMLDTSPICYQNEVSMLSRTLFAEPSTGLEQNIAHNGRINPTYNKNQFSKFKTTHHKPCRMKKSHDFSAQRKTLAHND